MQSRDENLLKQLDSDIAFQKKSCEGQHQVEQTPGTETNCGSASETVTFENRQLKGGSSGSTASDLPTMHSRIKALLQKLACTENQNELLERQLHEALAKAESMESKYKYEVEVLNGDLMVVRQRVEYVSNRLAYTERENNLMERQLQEALDEGAYTEEKYKIDCDTLSSENKKMREEINCLLASDKAAKKSAYIEHRRTQTKTQLRLAREENQVLSATIETLKAQVATLSSENQKLVAENSKLKASPRSIGTFEDSTNFTFTSPQELINDTLTAVVALTRRGWKTN